MQGTQITGGHISTTAVSADDKKASVDMFNAAQYEKPDVPHSVVTASDGSQWYQMASGEGRGAFYDAPIFNGAAADMPHHSGTGGTDPVVSTETGQPTGESLTHDGADNHPGMAPFTGVSEDSGIAGTSTVLTGDAADGHPNLVPFPSSMDEGTVAGGSQDGTVLTGDGTDVPQGMVAFPNSMEEGAAFGGGIQEGSVLTGDGMDVPAGMVASPAAREDQQQGGFALDESAPASTTLDTPCEAPQLSSAPAENLNIPGATVPVVSGEVVPDIGSVSPNGSAVPDDTAGVQHFGGFDGSFGAPPHAGGHSEVPGDGQGGSYESGPQNFYSEAPLVAATFPNAPEGTALRTVSDGVIEASSPDGGNTLWYNSAYFQEPDAPHTVMQSANGVDWYAMQQQADIPQFETGDAAAAYNKAAFQNFMPGYDLSVSQVDGSHRQDGHFEVRHDDGSGTKFYDTARYAAPRGDYQVYEDARGSQWYAIRGEAAVDRKPVFENGKPVYDDGKLRTVNVETVRYKQTTARFAEPEKRGDIERKPPKRKN